MCRAFWVIKQFANLNRRNGLQKEKIQNKIMQIKHTANVKITVDVNC